MVTLLAVVVVALVLFGVAVVATGRGDGMADVPPDRVTPRLPAGRVSADDVRSTRFALAFRGYRMDDVDSVLDRLADELAARDAELTSLRGAAPAAAASTAASTTAETPVSSPPAPASAPPPAP